jgi:hypothetical protein
MEKEFEFRELEGWQWHKTWMIPTITVTVLPENAKSAGNFTFPPNTYITVMCVRPGNRTPEKFFITETGLQGVTSQQAEVGRHVFTGLKFTETSYKQEVAKFLLREASLTLLSPCYTKKKAICTLPSSTVRYRRRFTWIPGSGAATP